MAKAWRRQGKWLAAACGAGALALWLGRSCLPPRAKTANDAVCKASTPRLSSNVGKDVTFAVKRARELVQRAMVEHGVPGAAVCVTVDGRKVWSEGLGYADLENSVHCSSRTVMRIASISKCLTAVAAMQLWERGKLDLDAPVQTYLPEFPRKTYNGQAVEITSKQLLSHMAGVRHYQQATDVHLGVKKREFDQEEYYNQKHYNSVQEALQVFSEDDLVYAPGTRFHYTTHGWTLLSAVIERSAGASFLDHLHNSIFSPLGMTSTGPEEHHKLTYNRARHYTRSKDGCLLNSPHVDNSYKWAGGGLISSAPDLATFGTALLLCLQASPSSSSPSLSPPLLLQSSTMAMMWSEVVRETHCSLPAYGLGWVVRSANQLVRGGVTCPLYLGHSGGAVGASSVLIVAPSNKEAVTHGDMVVAPGDGGPMGVVVASGNREPSGVVVASSNGEPSGMVVAPGDRGPRGVVVASGGGKTSGVVVASGDRGPSGVVVAILFNLQKVPGMFTLGSEIANEFLNY